MIVIYTNTERVYSHGADNMPKIEKIVQTHEDGLNFKNFLKYLPFQGYILDSLKILKVIEVEGKKVTPIEDISKWEKMLKKTVSAIGKEPQTPETQLKAERERNNELMQRLESLEAQVSSSLDTTPPTQEQKDEYRELYGKRVFGGWTATQVQDKINEKR